MIYVKYLKLCINYTRSI